jgi:hypothetical protein
MTNKSFRDYINLIENAQRESVTEMDKSAPQPGRDGRVSHSTYGSRDKGGSKGPEKEARPITAKKAAQDALDILKKQGVAEGSEQIYNILALDKGNALKKPTKLKWKASSLEDIFDALAAQDWYPLEINGIEVIAGKRLKQGVAEEQLEETTPEAIEKVNQLYRN